MEITVKDRQTLLDLAIIHLGSAAGAFALVRRNGISLTANLKDGQALTYEAAEIIAPAIRETFAVRGLSPATDMDRTEYHSLLRATGTLSNATDRIKPGAPAELPENSPPVDPLEEAISDAIAGRPPKENTTIHLTRIFQDAFDDTFA